MGSTELPYITYTNESKFLERNPSDLNGFQENLIVFLQNVYE
uniref:Uncharacterized protein n=1 Tax=Rhizophora mucronata TaxID=61149 RepID=A0A2P2M9Q5_RHIMU